MASSQSIVSHPFAVTLIRIKACQLCRRSDFSKSDSDDLQQDMRIYLMEKAHLFDPARGNVEAFVTYILNMWVAMRLRYRSRQKRSESYSTLSLESTPVKRRSHITTLGAIVVQGDGRRIKLTEGITATEQFELHEGIEHVMQQLAPEEQALLKHVAEHGVVSAARERNVSRRQITNLLNRVRSLFEKAGLAPTGRTA